jgi:hypothetical protein
MGLKKTVLYLGMSLGTGALLYTLAGWIISSGGSQGTANGKVAGAEIGNG